MQYYRREEIKVKFGECEHMKINVACGSTFSPGWVNIDFSPSSKGVKQVNILDGLPFSDGSGDVIYASHFLEHLTPEMADEFVRECYRVLRQGGTIRIVVPDLEEICSAYLEYRKSGQHELADFVAIEMLDQCVRMQSGGRLQQTYQRIHDAGDAAMMDFVYRRTGHDLREITGQKPTISEKLERLSWGKLVSILQRIYVKAISWLLPQSIRNQMLSSAMVGEKHLWMYDSKMLGDLLASAGFRDIQKMTFDKSGIENFQADGLDQDERGNPRKGCESMYVEAIK